MRIYLPVILVAYIGFVIQGLPDGILGVAWPSIRETFQISLDRFGEILTASAIGYFLASFNSGRMISRIGFGWFLGISSITTAIGLLGYVLSPEWILMVGFGVLVGMGSGAVDAGLNAYVASNYSTRHLNWLHACFGFGTALGPAIAILILNVGLSWRWGYMVTFLAQGLLAFFFLLTFVRRKKFREAKHLKEGALAPAEVRSRDTLKVPVVWFSSALFFMYSGIEMTAGQWSYSLFTEARGVDLTTAGLWVSIYWGSLTVGRLFLGALVQRQGVNLALRMSILGALVGAAMIWWNPADTISFFGLALIGLSLALVFPSLIAVTAARVGAAHAANAIGFQVASASVGIAVIPGLAGILAEKVGLEVIGPFLLLASLIMALLHEIVIWYGHRRGLRMRQ